MTVPDISEKIVVLYDALKKRGDSADDMAKKINDILLYGDRIPQNLLLPAWEIFAKIRGVEN